MKKERVLMLLLPDYADWEGALVAAGLRGGFGVMTKSYDVEIVAPTLEPVQSIGGFKTLPDYSFETMPDDFVALFLIGGMRWFSEASAGVLPLVHKAIAQEAILGGICDASVFLAVNGLVNQVCHTSNSLDAIMQKDTGGYAGSNLYIDQPSVWDGNVITASGVGFIEFACNVFRALKTAPDDIIEKVFETLKTGIYKP